MVSPARLVNDMPPSVLIVEDEPIVAAHQAAIMEEAGYKVVASTCDAETALVAADEAPPDVAIVDVRLAGGIDGITVGRELRRRHGTAIVFVTGQLEQAVRQIHDIGAVFVGKPFADREVLGAVRDALQQRAPH
jgi:DNA-binding response OmpR family regulator